MKKALLLLCFTGSAAIAQHTEGTITYSQKTAMRGRVQIADPAMQARMPESVTTGYQLMFTADEALYEPTVDDEPAGPGGGPAFRFNRPRTEIYSKIRERKRVELRDVFGDLYRIEDTLRSQRWKIGSETKTIKGIECRKATFSDSSSAQMLTFGGPMPAPQGQQPAQPKRSRTVVAWYAPEIPVSIGPDRYAGLPGLILEVDVNEGEMVTTVTEIDWKKPKSSELKQPKGGKAVTQTEFQDIMRQKMQQMNGERRVRIGG
ncbi:MAG: GLPGLI family protein [Siphonobacter aquaeclarae]|nr:GLPGLI family protein [Siphonobacter aquaeclarae]